MRTNWWGDNYDITPIMHQFVRNTAVLDKLTTQEWHLVYTEPQLKVVFLQKIHQTICYRVLVSVDYG